MTNWRIGARGGAQRSISQLLRTRSVSPARRKNGPRNGPHQMPNSSISRLRTPCRDQPGVNGRVQRENLQDRPVEIFHRDEATGFGHAAELAHDPGELRLRQVLGDVGAPHAVKGCVGEGQVQHAAEMRVDGGHTAPLPNQPLHVSDVLRRQIERCDPTGGPDEFAR